MSEPTDQEDDYKARLDAGLWWKIIRRAFHFKRYLVPLLLAALILAACDASFALITRWVIDGVVRDGARAGFAAYAVVYGAVTLTLCTCVWFFIWLAGNISNRLAHDIRRDGFDRLQQLEFAYYDTRPVGWLIARLTSDCDRLARTIAWGFLDVIWGFSLVLMIALSLLWLNWKLGLIILAIVPPLALVSRYFQQKLLHSSRIIRRYNSRITAAYNESIQGVRTTKTLGREADNLGEFQTLSTRMFDAAVLNARQNALYYPLVLTLGSLASGIALWRGGWLTLDAEITIGTLVAFVTFAGMFFNPVNQLAQRLTDIQAAQAAGERVMGLLETTPAIQDSPAVRARQTTGLSADIASIEFRDVTFRYATGPVVLENFNLTVQAGQTIALVGPSGGGKSTIVSLLCRFYEPVTGQILINGVDYRELPLAWLQSRLGVVLQTPHLFKGTIRDNIRYGRLDATDAEVEAAARLVNAHDFILQTEQGYDTPVGEGGNRFSTGQRQLLSFARALLADPRIFVMDEATSSIDTETEQLIQRGMAAMLAGRISFVIAHRLSTIRRADRILVIARGRIEESGTHEALLRQRGHYYGLYTNQFRREREQAALAAG